jgi:hypothetical protein
MSSAAVLPSTAKPSPRHARRKPLPAALDRRAPSQLGMIHICIGHRFPEAIRWN